MSAFSAWCQSIAGLIGESIVLVLVAKWTVLLVVAWLAHGMLAGCNPRWRVALWRATSVGVVLVAVLSWAPPIVEYRFAPATEPRSKSCDRHRLTRRHGSSGSGGD